MLLGNWFPFYGFLVSLIEAGCVGTCLLIPAIRRQKQTGSPGVQDQPDLHLEFQVSQRYTVRFCHVDWRPPVFFSPGEILPLLKLSSASRDVDIRTPPSPGQLCPAQVAKPCLLLMNWPYLWEPSPLTLPKAKFSFRSSRLMANNLCLPGMREVQCYRSLAEGSLRLNCSGAGVCHHR